MTLDAGEGNTADQVPNTADQVPNPPTKDDEFAPVALLLSILGLLGCFPVALAALAIAYLARERIRKSNGSLGGERTVRIAIVLGWVGVGVAAVAFLALLVAAIVRRST